MNKSFSFQDYMIYGDIINEILFSCYLLLLLFGQKASTRICVLRVYCFGICVGMHVYAYVSLNPIRN